MKHFMILPRRNIVLMLFGLVFVPTSLVISQNAVTLVDTLNIRHGGPGPRFGFYYASCWGYVAPDGHEYALIGCYSGISIIDLDTSPIREVTYIPGANSEWKEMKTWKHYAYAVSDVDGVQGVQIIDLSQLPDTAWLVRSLTSVGGKNVSRSHTVTVANGYLYLNGGTSGGTVILSLADPENPVYVGEYQPEYLHDTYVRNDTLYGAAINGIPPSGGVYVASVANKAAPQQLGHITYPNNGTHNVWASVNGRYVFTSDEVHSTAKNMKVFDIQNLPSYTQLTPFTADPASVIHNVHGRGNYVYIAHYTAGVFVADVHDPASIINAGTYDTYTGTSGGYIGCWGVYPYFPSGRWIGSDTQTGLYVFRFTGLAPRIRSPLLAPVNGDSVGSSGFINLEWRAAANQAEDPHYYKIHIIGSGVDTLVCSKDTTFTLPNLSAFQHGENYQWHLWIADEFTEVTSQDTFYFVFKGQEVGIKDTTLQPTRFVLEQNYPNPFNSGTTIRFDLRNSGFVTLKVYNVLGQEAATLMSGELPAGSHEVKWDAEGLSSGVYFYRLMTKGFTDVKKMMLMK